MFNVIPDLANENKHSVFLTQRRESRARLGCRGYEKMERRHSDPRDEGSCLPEAFTSAHSAPGRLPAGRQGRLGPSQGQRWSQKPGRALWGGQDSWRHLVCWELQGQDSWASVRPGLQEGPDSNDLARLMTALGVCPELPASLNFTRVRTPDLNAKISDLKRFGSGLP